MCYYPLPSYANRRNIICFRYHLIGFTIKYRLNLIGHAKVVQRRSYSFSRVLWSVSYRGYDSLCFLMKKLLFIYDTISILWCKPLNCIQPSLTEVAPLGLLLMPSRRCQHDRLLFWFEVVPSLLSTDEEHDPLNLAECLMRIPYTESSFGARVRLTAVDWIQALLYSLPSD